MTKPHLSYAFCNGESVATPFQKKSGQTVRLTQLICIVSNVIEVSNRYGKLSGFYWSVVGQIAQLLRSDVLSV
jgi:hypothetical protein